VQNETHQVVVQIEHGVEQVVLQSELVTQAGAALAEVDQLNQRLATDVQQINDIASEQAQAATHVAAIIKDLAYVSMQTSESMEQAHASMDYLVDLADALQRQISVFQVRKQATGPLMQASGGSSPLVAPQSGALPGMQSGMQSGALPGMQSGALSGRLRAPDGLALTMPPARRPDGPEPATQPIAAVSSPRVPPQRASARALLQETAPAPTIAGGGQSYPASPGASGQLRSDSGSLGSNGLGSGGLGSSHSWQPPHLTPLLADDTAGEQPAADGHEPGAHPESE
jgi:hypothetical protein